MSGSRQTTRFRFWLWLIRLIGVIVPRRLRADWRQEWEAELRYREELLGEWDRLNPRNKLDLLWRSTSASQKAPVLLRHKSSLCFQSSLSHSASKLSRQRNSASHSCRQSRRQRRGTITPTMRISQSQKRKRMVEVVPAISFTLLFADLRSVRRFRPPPITQAGLCSVHV